MTMTRQILVPYFYQEIQFQSKQCGCLSSRGKSQKNTVGLTIFASEKNEKLLSKKTISFGPIPKSQAITVLKHIFLKHTRNATKPDFGFFPYNIFNQIVFLAVVFNLILLSVLLLQQQNMSQKVPCKRYLTDHGHLRGLLDLRLLHFLGFF